MSSSLPREWGEPGALRVADVHSEPRQRKDCGRKVQQWIKDEFGDTDVASESHKARERAKKLRADNLKKFLECMARNQRPARVS